MSQSLKCHKHTCENITCHISKTTNCSIKPIKVPDDPEFTVDSLLPHLGLGAIECDINGYVLPMHTSLQQDVCPSLEAADSKWIAWDTPLDDSKRLHMMICDRELFISICHHARVHNWVINLGGCNPADRILAYEASLPSTNRGR